MMKRKMGILLPVFSLFGEYGIGTFGKPAYEFVDFLADAKVGVWQILPLCPVDASGSPYSSGCSAAISPLYIDPEILRDKGLLTFDECEKEKIPFGRLNYSLLKERTKTLYKAFCRCDGEIPHFPQSVFLALKEHFGTRWQEWGECSDCNSFGVKNFTQKHELQVRFMDFLQFEAQSQWQKLREYALSKGVEFLGDMPFYVAGDSYETWSKSELFDTTSVAGVPPDYFSATGQLWGNPVYKVGEDLKKWWSERIYSALDLFDMLRLDHFRAFDSFYAIKSGSKDATVGEWRLGLGKEFFLDKRNLPIVAEDLGTITPSVSELLEFTGYPGMRVLQFGLSGDNNPHSPENIGENCVCYTGTHDNMPLRTFVERNGEEVRRVVGNCDDIEAVDRLIEIGSRTKAKLFVAPLFDFMHKGESYRINTPSTVSEYNWSVRFKRSDLYGLDKAIRSAAKVGDRI